MSFVRRSEDTLITILRNHDYALALSPGFFFMYAHTGFLRALDELGALRVTHISGASAGSIAGGFYASGMSTTEMTDALFELRREDMWDIGGFAGLLKGQLMQSQLEKRLLVKNMEECRLPLGVTAYDVFRFETKCINKGDLASSIRASCCVPVLFQPVLIDGWPCVDGGTFDWNGAMALSGVPNSNLLVNVLCGRSQLLQFPLANNPALCKRKDIQVLSLVYENVPRVSPFSMQTTGPQAFDAARQATKRLLSEVTLTSMQKFGPNHWFIVIDGSLKDLPLQVSLLPNDLGADAPLQSRKKRKKLAVTVVAQKRNTRSSCQREKSTRIRLSKSK